MESQYSPLQEERYNYTPKLPAGISGDFAGISIRFGENTEAVADRTELRAMFPNTYGKPAATFCNTPGAGTQKKDPVVMGVILSGGQAPGGHNVIAGLFDGLKKINPASRLLGFLGLITKRCGNQYSLVDLFL